MNFPASREQLKAAGYRFSFARRCKRCDAALEFYDTPAGRLAPLEGVLVEGKWLMDSHFKTCPFRDEFRRAAPKAASPPEPVRQGDLFGGKAK